MAFALSLPALVVPARPVPAPTGGLERALRAHQDRVYGYAFHLLRDADDAADVAQEAFIRFWHRGAGVPEAAERAWLLRTVQRLALDRFRRQRHLTVGTDSVADTLPDGAASPHDAAEDDDLRAFAFAALGTLGEPYKSLVLLCDVQGQPYAEAGEALGLPLTSVKVYLHRARHRLREAYFRRTRDHA